MFDEIIVTQPQAKVFPLQFGRNQRVKLQRRPESRTFLTFKLNLQTFKQKANV